MTILKTIQNKIADTYKLYTDGVRAGQTFGAAPLTCSKSGTGEFLMELKKPHLYRLGFIHGLKQRTGYAPRVRHVSGQTFGLTI